MLILWFSLAVLTTVSLVFAQCHICLTVSLCVVRWAVQGNGRFLYSHITGITGVIALISTMMISLPMLVPWLKTRMTWEQRKGMHYMCIAWGIALVFHAPAMHICYIMGSTVTLYLLDYGYGFWIRTHLIRTLELTR